MGSVRAFASEGAQFAIARRADSVWGRLSESLNGFAKAMPWFSGSDGAGALSGLVSLCNKVKAAAFDPDWSNRLKRARRMARGVVQTAKGLEASLTSAGVKFRTAMVTLTYRPGAEWAASHVRDVLRHYRLWCLRRHVEFRYVWVLELTRAGVPHYHIVIFLPLGITPPLPDKQGWWPHGMTQAKWARSPVGYIAKYASKGSDGRGELPKGARLWGSGGVSKDIKGVVRWALAPSWVRFLSGDPSESVRKRTVAKDGDDWWEFGDRGFMCRSPWGFDAITGVVQWRGWAAWDVEYL